MSVKEQDNKYAIDVAEVTKVYRLYEKPIDRLKESMSISHKNYHRDFYALNQLSFRVRKGETVGIIGTNGSGKSTILKIITGVLTPTTGEVKVDGKISALLELGAGFNMDYTGIENIYMNGTMMGYTKKEMDAKLQDILDFAEIGDFVYQPVQRYVCTAGFCVGHQCGPGNPHCGRGPFRRRCVLPVKMLPQNGGDPPEGDNHPYGDP